LELDVDGLGVDDEDLLARAYAAYHRSCKTNGWVYQAPRESLSRVEEHAGKRYVVLRNGGGVLQVYRVRNDGMLKGLKRRWPKALAAG
jgi:hypothetical protein